MKLSKQVIVYTYIVLSLLPLSINTAQTITNENALSAFAQLRHLEYLKNKKEVEEYSKINNISVRQILPNGGVMEMIRIENDAPIFYITTNLGAAQTTRANELWPGGNLGLSITGDGYNKIGEWDGGGVLLTHQELNGRVTQVDGAITLSDHSTHVAGTLIASGIDPLAQGMAYESDLDAYDWNNDESEMATAAINGLEVSNHSYSIGSGWFSSGSIIYWGGDVSISADEDWWFGHYHNDTKLWDQIAYDAPNYLIVKSAGNDRGDHYVGGHWHYDKNKWKIATDTHPADGGLLGYDCIAIKGVAKNILTVGAVEEVLNYTSPSDVVMSSFSSWGPTDDGRIKPDLVGKGVSLKSSVATNDVAYAYYSGTSMSAPNVAGTLALLQQHYKYTHSSVPMRSATLKGLTIHTTDEAGPAAGPDYMFGWGLMSAERAAELISLDSYGNDIIDEQVLTDGSIYTGNINSDGTKPLRVTVCWTDPPGIPVLSNPLNNRTPMLVNDLDLKLTANSTTYYPWKLDPDNPSFAATNAGENNVDNVEQVFIATPTAGTYSIEVSHDGTLSGGSQAFSIIVSGHSVCYDGSLIYNTETNSFNFCEDGMWEEK
ncbi:S8 family serine peptidase [Candidatus Neomarinimicrobiota bacterium]